MEESILEQYRDRYQKELEALRIRHSVLDQEMGRVWRNESTGGYFIYFIGEMRNVEERIKELEEILSNPEKLLEAGKLDDLKEKDEKLQKYRKRYQAKLKNLIFLETLTEEKLGDEIKEESDVEKEASVRGELEGYRIEIEKLKGILQDPEKILETGKADDLEIEREYEREKEKYQSLSLFQKLKSRVQGTSIFDQKYSDNTVIENGRSR